MSMGRVGGRSISWGMWGTTTDQLAEDSHRRYRIVEACQICSTSRALTQATIMSENVIYHIKSIYPLNDLGVGDAADL